MKAHIKNRHGQIVVEVEGQTFKDIVRASSEIEEIFRITHCGACKSMDVRLSYRRTGDYDFYEVLCEACGAALALGVRKSDGRLFPRRKDDHDHQLPNDGWRNWRGEGNAAGAGGDDFGEPPPPRGGK